MADDTNVTNVQTDTDTGAAVPAAPATETVLTGAAADAGATDTNSDAAADTVLTGAAADDAGATDDAGAADEGTNVVPDTYADFVMPDGVQLDEGALAKASPIFKELGLSQENAQKVVDLYAEQVQAGVQKNIDAFTQLTTEWREAAENDKEYGGDKFEENAKIAQNAVDKFGTQELKQLMQDHGIGNHPEMIRFMVRVGRTLPEDVPGATGSSTTTSEDRVSILYPNNPKKEE